ncbi:MAG TPA: phosphoenolpyruvate--protein phosphotransferase [Elusimicrobia bacterium]|nr:phosphoenolpyruvate--protein phosphotransferase [Elusimicrobiota bacterium]HBW22357.1 phosphoenolpyruvate--protein phosphotransferase [Elusimicrobiota bacterium]
MAPLSGILMPIEAVPDPVFARKVVGDGASLDPTTQILLAPCAGSVLNIHSAGHALTIGAEGGLEVLLHIGIDTVQLKGAGFTPRVKAGDKVAEGQPLIEFAADEVAKKARSLLTQIVITTPELVGKMRKYGGSVLAGKDPVLTIELAAGEAGHAAQEAGAPIVSKAVVIPNSSGLHARPAATLARLARAYRCDLRLRKGDAQANLRSVSSVMGLDVRQGDKVFIVACGHDAKEAVDAILPALEKGLGEESAGAASAPASSAPAARPAASGNRDLLAGISASPGLASGRAFILSQTKSHVPEHGETPEQERRLLGEAVAAARLQLDALQDRLKLSGDAGKSEIFGAHLELLEDPDLFELAESAIAKGKSAAFSWKEAFTAHADRLAGMSNELLAARAGDLRDVGRRVLKQLLGEPDENISGIPAGSILIAEELTPSDIASLDRTKVPGCATVGGGPTSHIAILAQSFGLPLVVGLEPHALEIPAGAAIILDADKGVVGVNPPAKDLEEVRARIERAARQKREEAGAAGRPALTLDGHRIEVFANLSAAGEAAEAVKLGAEGVGLLRSEFLFLNRTEAPSEEEQTRAYQAAAAALGKERPLIIRTLDAGGDKQLPYLQLPKEENPFLGERGIRIGLAHPDILRTQARAVLRAAQAGKVRIMFPMISDIEEYRAARAIVLEEAKRLGASPIQVGIMIEVPSAAVLAELFAAEADFFSIGTNDLTQYTLAMDRGHPRLAGKADALHPSVLRLIGMVVEAARAHGKPVGVCGGLAGDPRGIPLLLGLGVTELSVSAPAVPSVKAAVRGLKLEDCRLLAKRAVSLGTAAEVRALIPAQARA